MNKNELIEIRSGQEDDFNLIMATVLRGLYYGDSAFSTMKKQTFMEYYQRVILKLISSPEVSVNVACLKEDPTVVLGYALVSIDQQVVHWVFVKKRWRKIGIAKALVSPNVTICTHLTALGNIVKKSIEFNPFKLPF